MQIAFTSTVEAGDVLVLPFQKDAVDTGRIEGEGAAALAKAAVDAARFKGEAGSIVELFATVGGTARRILLLGVGEGKEADWRKAGGALTAKLLTNATSASVDLTGLSTKPAAEAVASFAGAAVQRGWRHDVYRTKLPETSKPTLTKIAIVDAGADAESAYARVHAVNGGLELTRTLVSEPPNKLYPETFVERVLADVEGLGLEVTVLDEAQMRDLGMGALLGVSQGSVREEPAGPEVERRCGGCGDAGASRQGRDLRHRRHFDQARSGHGRHEVGHGRRRCGCRCHEGDRGAQGQGQRRRRHGSG